MWSIASQRISIASPPRSPFPPWIGRMSRQYDILEHGAMIADRLRMDGYLESIRRAVQPGSVVVDVGSGAGIFALAACRAGARRVYAIEPGAIVQVAREIVAANGFAARVEFIEQ